MKNCLVTTIGSSELFISALQNLESALKSEMSEDIHFEIQNLPTLNASIEHFARTAIPHLLMIEPKNFTGDSDGKKIGAFFQGLRDLDPAVCIVVLWNSNPSASELMTWLDRGATGLFNAASKNAESETALLEALAQRVSAHLAREPRSLTRHKVHVQLASLEQALAAETLNLGFGGMFLRIQPREIKAGDQVEFQLEFGGSLSVQGESPTDTIALLKKMDEAPKSSNAVTRTKIEGTGRVVWIRNTHKDGLPEGIGLQFSKLSPEVSSEIRNFVVNHRLHAFIPKA